RAATIRRQLRVNVTVARLIPPRHATLIVGSAVRPQVLAQQSSITGAVDEVREAGAKVDTQGGPLVGFRDPGSAQVEAPEEGMVVPQGEDAPLLGVQEGPALVTRA